MHLDPFVTPVNMGLAKLVIGAATFGVCLYLSVSKGGAAAIWWGTLAGVGFVVALIQAVNYKNWDKEDEKDGLFSGETLRHFDS